MGTKTVPEVSKAAAVAKSAPAAIAVPDISNSNGPKSVIKTPGHGKKEKKEKKEKKDKSDKSLKRSATETVGSAKEQQPAAQKQKTETKTETAAVTSQIQSQAAAEGQAVA